MWHRINMSAFPVCALNKVFVNADALLDITKDEGLYLYCDESDSINVHSRKSQW